MTHLANPWWLISLLAVPALAWLYYRRQKRDDSSLIIPSAHLIVDLPRRLLGRGRLSRHSESLRHLGCIFRLACLVALAFALARPQDGESKRKRHSEGLDIVLVTDTSGSMKQRDFVMHGEEYNRLDVIKEVIANFIKDRIDDRIGLVIFGSEAFTQAPLTLDHDLLLRFLGQVQIGMAGEATAIGDGLATAVNRLKNLQAKSRVVILLTDGGDSGGKINPLEAAAAAKANGVRVYTIGVGAREEADKGQQPGDVDEKLLQDIATNTGGRYFYATDTEALVKVYQTIDKLEKTKTETEQYENYQERFAPLVLIALGFLVLELVFAMSRFRKIP